MQVFVLGMHRSGGAAVGGILQRMGLYAGTTPPETPEEDYPAGSWEHPNVVALNEGLLALTGRDWSRPIGFDLRRLAGKLPTVFQPKANALLGDLEDHRPWFIKDPRLCLVFPAWKRLVEDPHCIIPFRRPEEVAAILRVRHGFSASHALALWEHYTVQVLQNTAGLSRSFVFYDDLLARSQETAARLFEELRPRCPSGLFPPRATEIRGVIDSSAALPTGSSAKIAITSFQDKLFQLMGRPELLGEVEGQLETSASALEELAAYDQLHSSFAYEAEQFAELSVRLDGYEREKESQLEEIIFLRQQTRDAELMGVRRELEAERKLSEVAERDSLVSEYEAKVGGLVDSQERLVREMTREHQTQVTKLNEDHRQQMRITEDRLRAVRTTLEQETEDARNERLSEIETLTRRLDLYVRSLREAVASMEQSGPALAEAGMGASQEIAELSQSLHELASAGGLGGKFRGGGKLSRIADELETASKNLRSEAARSPFQKKSELEGQAEEVSARSIRGWIWNPLRPFERIGVQIHLDGEVVGEVWADQFRDDLLAEGRGDGYHGFEFLLPPEYHDGESHVIDLRPESYWHRFENLPVTRWLRSREDSEPESLLSDKKPAETVERPSLPPRHSEAGAEEPPLVIVQVGSDADPDLRTLWSLEDGAQPLSYQLLLCLQPDTSDARARELQTFVSSRDHCQLLTPPPSDGPAGLLNWIAAKFPAGDLIHVEEGSILTRGWLQRLIRAGQEEGIALVSPVCDSPFFWNEEQSPPYADRDPEGVAEELASNPSAPIRTNLPGIKAPVTLIKRSALEKVGAFDEASFGADGAALIDFALRCRGLGLHHVLAADSYARDPIPSSRNEIGKSSMERLEAVHPGWLARARHWCVVGSPDPEPPSDAAGEQSEETKEEPPAEVDTPTRPGSVLLIGQNPHGRPTQLGSVLASEMDRTLLHLIPTLREWKIYELKQGKSRLLATYGFAAPWTIGSGLDAERTKALGKILDDHPVGLVHFLHLACLGHDAPLFFKQRSLRVIASFEDYFPVCPSGQLRSDEEEEECALPSPWQIGDITHFKSYEALRHRTATGQSLAGLDHLVAVSAESKVLMQRRLPEIRDVPFSVIPTGRNLYPQEVGEAAREDRKIRVACLPPLTVDEGGGFACELARINNEQRGPFEFHFVGEVPSSLPVEEWGVILHQPSSERLSGDTLAGIRPSLCLIAPDWPDPVGAEITEAWCAGVPVVVSDVETLASRVRETKAGWVVNHLDPENALQQMGKIARNRDEYDKILETVSKLRFKTASKTASEYDHLYSFLLEEEEEEASGSEA